MNYKHYVYLKVSKEEFEQILTEKKCVPVEEIRKWQEEYKTDTILKKWGAKKAQKHLKANTIKKLIIALENYYTGLFKENKPITGYKLGKLAGVHPATANKYLKEWKEILNNPDKDQAIWELKIKYNLI